MASRLTKARTNWKSNIIIHYLEVKLDMGESCYFAGQSSSRWNFTRDQQVRVLTGSKCISPPSSLKLHLNDLSRCLFFAVHSFCIAAVSATGPFVLNSFSLAGKTEASWWGIGGTVLSKLLTVEAIWWSEAWGPVQPLRECSLTTITHW